MNSSLFQRLFWSKKADDTAHSSLAGPLSHRTSSRTLAVLISKAGTTRASGPHLVDEPHANLGRSLRPSVRLSGLLHSAVGLLAACLQEAM